MGCFLACFGSSKDQKRKKQRNTVLPRDQRYGSQKPLPQTISSEQDISEESTNPNLELREKPGEQLSLSTRKKVAFDSNVKIYEPVSVHDSTDFLPESDKGSEKEKEETSAKSSQSHCVPKNDSASLTIGSYPPNHRYQNSRDSHEKVEELEDECSDLDDEEEQNYYDYDEEEDDRNVGQNVWAESIPTAAMKSSTKASSTLVFKETAECHMTMSGSGLAMQGVKTIGLNRIARDRSVYVHPVLNPVENLSQWKAMKLKGTPPLKVDKENCIAEDQEAPRISFTLEPTFKQSSSYFKSRFDQPKNSNQEIAVDASLSNWLISSETTPTRKTSSTGIETITSEKNISRGSNSVMSMDDRPILGALTVEELQQFYASASPRRRSPSPSPDEMPIIGTVGTYWSTDPAKESSDSASSYKGIPNTTSKYREDKRVNWHSTPFETRLERALNRGVAEA